EMGTGSRGPVAALHAALLPHGGGPRHHEPMPRLRRREGVPGLPQSGAGVRRVPRAARPTAGGRRPALRRHLPGRALARAGRVLGGAELRTAHVAAHGGLAAALRGAVHPAAAAGEGRRCGLHDPDGLHGTGRAGQRPGSGDPRRPQGGRAWL
ncbi:MAG: protein of unknown function DUF983, partial [uncultured Acetobacteraceae bacterium]